jgi:hypothetical protein
MVEPCTAFAEIATGAINVLDPHVVLLCSCPALTLGSSQKRLTTEYSTPNDYRTVDAKTGIY